MRSARWWFLATTVLFVVGWIPLIVAGLRNDVWIADALAHHCRYSPPIPDNRMLGWLVVGFVGGAMITSLAGLAFVVIGRHRWWVKVGAAALGLVFLVIALWVLLIGHLQTDPPAPGQGVDGSGSPCPGG